MSRDPSSRLCTRSHSQSSLHSSLTCAKAAAVGLATPLCSCGAIPIAVGLHAAGASLPAVVAFLTASQGAGLDSAMIVSLRVETDAIELSRLTFYFLYPPPPKKTTTTTDARSPRPGRCGAPSRRCRLSRRRRGARCARPEQGKERDRVDDQEQKQKQKQEEEEEQ